MLRTEETVRPIYIFTKDNQILVLLGICYVQLESNTSESNKTISKKKITPTKYYDFYRPEYVK